MSESQGNTIRIPHGRTHAASDSTPQQPAANTAVPAPAATPAPTTAPAAKSVVTAAPAPDAEPIVGPKSSSPAPNTSKTAPNTIQKAANTLPNVPNTPSPAPNIPAKAPNTNPQPAKKPAKKSTKKTRRLVAIIAGIVVALALIAGVVVWLIVAFWHNPEDDLVGNDAIQEAAVKLYEEHDGSTEEIAKFFQRRAKKAETQSAKSELMLLELSTYVAVGRPDVAVAMSKEINIDEIPAELVGRYCGIMYNAAMGMGDTCLANSFLEHLGFSEEGSSESGGTDSEIDGAQGEG